MDELKNVEEEVKPERKKSLVEKVFDIDGLIRKILPEKIYTKIAPFIESALFVFWGVVTTAIGLVFYMFLVYFKICDYKLAKFLQMIFSKVLSYISNKFGVFKTTENKTSEDVIEVTLFIVTRLLTMVLDYVLLIVFVQVGMNELIASIVEFPIIIGINYLCGKFIVYNRTLQIFLRKKLKL